MGSFSIAQEKSLSLVLVPFLTKHLLLTHYSKNTQHMLQCFASGPLILTSQRLLFVNFLLSGSQ